MIINRSITNYIGLIVLAMTVGLAGCQSDSGSSSGGGDGASGGGDGGETTPNVIASLSEVEDPIRGLEVTLDASESSGDGDQALEYEWEILDSPQEAQAQLDGVGDQATLVPDAVGTWEVSVTVSQGDGSDTDSTAFTVIEDEPNVTANLAGVENAIRGLEVTLDAGGSSGDGDQALEYEWEILDSPQETQAQLDWKDDKATLAPDAAGTWEVAVTVTQESVSDTDSTVFTVVENEPPEVQVQSAGFGLGLGDSVSLDASDSHDPEGQPLEYRWGVSAAPDGSELEGTDDTGETFTFVPDVTGSYTVTLAVDDGVNVPVTETVTGPIVETIGEYGVLAEYEFVAGAVDENAATNLIVAVSSESQEAHIVDTESGAVTSVALPKSPLSVSISEDGAEAVVGHDAWISLVDLGNAEVIDSFPVGAVANSVVHGSNGYAYVVPTGQWVRMKAVDLEDGATYDHQGLSVYGGTIIKLYPDGDWIYGANNGLSPSDIMKFSIQSETPNYLYDSPYHGDYQMCGDLWITSDGDKIVTQCGNVFYARHDQDEDMTYAGALDVDGLGAVEWASHSGNDEEIAAIVSVAEGSGSEWQLVTFDDTYLNQTGATAMPTYSREGENYDITPQVVSYRASSEGTVVLGRIEDGAEPLGSILLRK